jgi:hypothetical protein
MATQESTSQILLLTIALSLITIFSIWNSARILHGKRPILVRRPSADYDTSVRTQRYLATSFVSPSAWIGFDLILIAKLASNPNNRGPVHGLERVPFDIGFALFIVSLLLMIAIYMFGKPSFLILQRFRGAASNAWQDTSGGMLN